MRSKMRQQRAVAQAAVADRQAEAVAVAIAAGIGLMGVLGGLVTLLH